MPISQRVVLVSHDMIATEKTKFSSQTNKTDPLNPNSEVRVHYGRNR